MRTCTYVHACNNYCFCLGKLASAVQQNLSKLWLTEIILCCCLPLDSLFGLVMAGFSHASVVGYGVEKCLVALS